MKLILTDPKPLAPQIARDARPLTMANRFKIQVVERRHNRHRGRVVRSTPWQANLILDQGMDRVASDVIVNLFTYCVIGTGNTATEALSGGITATTSGTTCTSDSPIFASTDVGSLLRFTTGEKAKITAFTDSQHVTLAATLGVTGQTFKMYRVNQTGLTTEKTGAGYRNNNYLTGAGNCGSTLSTNVLTHRRTYDFPIEVSDQNYAEVGFSHTATVAANCNSRALFSGGSVTVLTGQQLRVVYDFIVTLSPTSTRSKKFPVTGWPSLQSAVTVDSTTDKVTLTSHGLPADTEVVFGGSGAPGGITFGTPYYVVVDTANTFKVSATIGGSAIDITSNGTSVYLLTNTSGTELLMQAGLSSVTTAGAGATYETAGGNPQNASEPSATGQITVATDSGAQPSFPVSSGLSWSGIPTGGTQNLALDTYTNGTFTRTKSVTFTTGQANSAAIRTIAIGPASAGSNKTGIRFLFNNPQEKTSINTLTIRFRFTWDRDFS